MLGCAVPVAAVLNPGSWKITQESLFISLRLKETEGLSVFTRISVPARSVLWLPVILKSLPLRLRTIGCCAAAPPAPPAAAPGPAPPARGAAAPGPAPAPGPAAAG